MHSSTIYQDSVSDQHFSSPGLSEQTDSQLIENLGFRNESEVRGFFCSERIGRFADRKARIFPGDLGVLASARHPHGEQGHGLKQQQCQESILHDSNRSICGPSSLLPDQPS